MIRDLSNQLNGVLVIKARETAKNIICVYSVHMHPIQTEAQYLEMLDFMRDLMRGYNTELEPHKSLWRLATQYIIEWETVHDDMASEPLRGFEVLQALADAQNFTQAQFAAKLEVNQGHLSRILRGERRISQKLATRVERFFRIPMDVLLKS